MPAQPYHPLNRGSVRAMLTQSDIFPGRYRVTIFDDRAKGHHGTGITRMGYWPYPKEKAIAKAERLVEEQKAKEASEPEIIWVIN